MGISTENFAPIKAVVELSSGLAPQREDQLTLLARALTLAAVLTNVPLEVVKQQIEMSYNDLQAMVRNGQIVAHDTNHRRVTR